MHSKKTRNWQQLTIAQSVFQMPYYTWISLVHQAVNDLAVCNLDVSSSSWHCDVAETRCTWCHLDINILALIKKQWMMHIKNPLIYLLLLWVIISIIHHMFKNKTYTAIYRPNSSSPQFWPTGATVLFSSQGACALSKIQIYWSMDTAAIHI